MAIRRRGIMAVQRIIFGVGLLQIISSLASIALCTRHYSDTEHMKTSISHVAVMFAVRCLPSLSLLVCGIMGVIISCVNNRTAHVVHTTMTAQTMVGIAMNIWFFAYQTYYSDIRYDQGSANKCMIAAIFCLIVCIGYLAYLIIAQCRYSSANSEMSEKTNLSDVESSVSGLSSGTFSTTSSKAKLAATKY